MKTAPACKMLQDLWTHHGTKILGGVTALVGAVALLTPADFAIYGIDGHTALRITAISTGLLTLLRGFQNTHVSTPKRKRK